MSSCPRPVDVRQLAFLSGQGSRWPGWPQLGCQGPKDFYSVYLNYFVGPSKTKSDDFEKESLDPPGHEVAEAEKAGIDF